MTRGKKKLPADTAWPPAGVRDLKPEFPVSDRADQVRFPTLRTALAGAAYSLRLNCAMLKKTPAAAHILSPEEYPESITAPAFPGAHKTPPIFAVQHPLGLYHVEDEGAGTLGVYFTPRRAKKPKRLASAANMAGAFRRISHHEDDLIHPSAEREEGKHGSVSIYALGQRTKEAKPKSQLDHELDTWLTEHGYGT